MVIVRYTAAARWDEEEDWVAKRKKAEGQGEQGETKDTLSHSVKLSVEHLKKIPRNVTQLR